MDPSPHASIQRTGPRIAMVMEQLWQQVPGGSGTYIRRLVSALDDAGAYIAGITARHTELVDPQDNGLPAHIPICQSRLPRPFLYEAWNRLAQPRAEALVPGAEVIHATTWAIPATRLPLVVTVHDLAFIRSPEHFTPRGRRYFLRSLQRTAAHADAIIVPSQATADDCVEWGIPSSRITLIPHGVQLRQVGDDEVKGFCQRWSLSRPYILWTGTREPRKNLSALLEAFSLLIQRGESDLDLVLVGPQGWGNDAHERALVEPMKDRIHILGHLSESDLASAYRGARAFCFPSHWEGFGLPVLEAMASGTPVVTSRGTCMEEVVSDAALLADPHDPHEIADQLMRATGTEHRALREAGLVQARHFTWEQSAEAHAQLFQQLATRGAV